MTRTRTRLLALTTITAAARASARHRRHELTRLRIAFLLAGALAILGAGAAAFPSAASAWGGTYVVRACEAASNINNSWQTATSGHAGVAAYTACPESQLSEARARDASERDGNPDGMAT
jgi:hypothetical protein